MSKPKTKREVCTREDILKSQEIIKKEPFMLDDVDKWMYYIREETQHDKWKKGSFKSKYCSKTKC